MFTKLKFWTTRSFRRNKRNNIVWALNNTGVVKLALSSIMKDSKLHAAHVFNLWGFICIGLVVDVTLALILIVSTNHSRLFRMRRNVNFNIIAIVELNDVHVIGKKDTIDPDTATPWFMMTMSFKARQSND